ncbi:MAG: hypothetical protein Q8Q67_03075 [bacterium]|nr:hypothetical protein [bacterium]
MLKQINNWWQDRRNRFYRRRRLHLALEIFLITVILLLAGLALFLSSYHPALNGTFFPDGNATSSDPTSTKLVYTVSADSQSLVVSRGDSLDSTITFKNNGTSKISDVEMLIDFDSYAFELSSLQADGEGVTVRDDKILLENIKPGDTIVINSKASWRAIKNDFPRSIKSKLIVTASNNEARLVKEVSVPDYRITSDLKIEAAAYYHSPQGDQLGIGPIPPIVGVPTTYWLIVKAENNGNDLNNLALSFHLPVGVELTGDVSLLAGKYSYNAATRRLIWQLESVDASGGDYFANFAIALTPNESQIGKNILLVDQIQYHADDSWTSEVISSQLSNIDTSLPADRFNRGQGQVSAE